MSGDRKKKSLWVLAYALDSRQTTLVKLSELELKVDDISGVNPQDLKINLKNKTWSFHDYKNIPIGQGREGLGEDNFSRWGVIGVYDQSNDTHVKELVLNAQNAVKMPYEAYNFKR